MLPPEKKEALDNAIEAICLVVKKKGFSQDDTDKSIILSIIDAARKGVSSSRKNEPKLQLTDIYDRRDYEIV